MVLQRLRRKQVIGRAMCVPIGPKGVALHWQIVSPEDSATRSGVESRNVFILRCECGRYNADELSLARVHGQVCLGHLYECLQPVPRYSTDESAALEIWRRYESIEVVKRPEGSKYRVSVTVYDEPGVFVEGESLAHALSLAVVAMAGGA